MKNDTLKILTPETRAALVASIASTAVESLIMKTKSSSDSDSGTFKVIVSTADVDRQGESVSQAGWDLSFYKSNPVVLWAHDYASLPIGVCTSIDVKDGKLVAEGKFAPADANPLAQQIRKLYDLGMVNTTSVGFIPKEFDQSRDGVISKSELLEFSFVPVPANPYALRLNQIKELGIDTLMLKTKGIEVKEEGEPVPATPTETTPTPEAIPTEEKGAVADRLDIMKKQKYAMFRPIWDVMDALACTYFDESTLAEDLPMLLNETAEIMKTLGGTTPDQTAIKEAMTKLSRGIKVNDVSESVVAVMRNYVVLGSIKLPEGNENGKGESAVPQRSKNPEALREVTAFVETRSLLRQIDNSIEKVLRNFNAAARTRS